MKGTMIALRKAQKRVRELEEQVKELEEQLNVVRQWLPPKTLAMMRQQQEAV
tara:strand:+ start:62 stop:217 length:156 start_codon:yes stop_codon:yes gene_type:complete